jgi:hypothetical protein
MRRQGILFYQLAVIKESLQRLRRLHVRIKVLPRQTYRRSSKILCVDLPHASLLRLYYRQILVEILLWQSRGRGVVRQILLLPLRPRRQRRARLRSFGPYCCFHRSKPVFCLLRGVILSNRRNGQVIFRCVLPLLGWSRRRGL